MPANPQDVDSLQLHSDAPGEISGKEAQERPFKKLP